MLLYRSGQGRSTQPIKRLDLGWTKKTKAIKSGGYMVYIKDKKGRLHSIKELATKFNLPMSTIYSRYKNGTEFEKLALPKYEKGDYL